MNFAPYQDDSPENQRALSPPPPRTLSPTPRVTSPKSQPDRLNTGAYSDRLPSPGRFEGDVENQHHQQQQTPQRGFGNGIGADERNLDVFGTSLPMRLDYEACACYLALPPAGPALILLLEHKSDYVRFHAWQSALLFTFLFALHIIFSFSKVISFIILVIDLVLMAFLTLHAYKDANTLDRCELPFFGKYASNFVDAE